MNALLLLGINVKDYATQATPNTLSAFAEFRFWRGWVRQLQRGVS